MKERLEIPARWCHDKNIRSAFLSMEEAEEIMSSGIADEDSVEIVALFKAQEKGFTRTPAGAVRAKYYERLLTNTRK